VRAARLFTVFELFESRIVMREKSVEGLFYSRVSVQSIYRPLWNHKATP